MRKQSLKNVARGKKFIPGSTWKFEIWSEVLSWLPHTSPKYSPAKTSCWRENFRSAKVAEEYADRLRKKYPEREVGIVDQYVLSNDGGQTGHEVGFTRLSPKRTGKLTQYS